MRCRVILHVLQITNGDPSITWGIASWPSTQTQARAPGFKPPPCPLPTVCLDKLFERSVHRQSYLLNWTSNYTHHGVVWELNELEPSLAHWRTWFFKVSYYYACADLNVSIFKLSAQKVFTGRNQEQRQPKIIYLTQV